MVFRSFLKVAWAAETLLDVTPAETFIFAWRGVPVLRQGILPPQAPQAPQAPGSSTPAGKPPQEGGGADRKKKRRRGPESDQERAARIEKRKAERKAREEAALARLGASRAGILLQEQLERRGQA